MRDAHVTCGGTQMPKLTKASAMIATTIGPVADEPPVGEDRDDGRQRSGHRAGR